MNEHDRIRELGAELVRLLEEQIPVLLGDLGHVVRDLLGRREALIALAQQHGTPLYVLDLPELDAAISRYVGAFDAHLPGSRHFYAVKLNDCEALLRRVVQRGMGLDVSSGRELQIGLRCGAKHFLFSGPGKSEADLELALTADANVTVNLDSFRELQRLDVVSRRLGLEARAGVRVFSERFGAWGKFGIPLGQLQPFWDQAAACRYVRLCGLQFHMSWNRDARPYVAMAEELASALTGQLSAVQRGTIEFVDIGGGFRPYRAEGTFPWKLPAGEVQRALEHAGAGAASFADRYLLTDSVPIDEYACGIADGLNRTLGPLLSCAWYTEPGRIIANQAMHVLVRIVDVKRPGCAIADGGINLVGWERFENDYFPLINLSHPDAEQEIEHTVYGSLCMPQDLWGYYIYGSGVHEGDLVLVPYQGALTFSLRQEFIKPIAPVVEMASHEFAGVDER